MVLTCDAVRVLLNHAVYTAHERDVNRLHNVQVYCLDPADDEDRVGVAVNDSVYM